MTQYECVHLIGCAVAVTLMPAKNTSSILFCLIKLKIVRDANPISLQLSDVECLCQSSFIKKVVDKKIHIKTSFLQSSSTLPLIRADPRVFGALSRFSLGGHTHQHVNTRFFAIPNVLHL